jgi:hypothetical protein
MKTDKPENSNDFDLLTPEQAAELVLKALQGDTDEPEGLAYLLTRLQSFVDQGANRARISDAIDFMLSACYDRSAARSNAASAYIAAIANRQQPIAAAEDKEDAGDSGQETDEEQTNRELYRSFAKVCADLAGPLTAFLEHPLVPENVAENVSNGIFEMRNVMDMGTTATESIHYDLSIVALMATLRERAGNFD